MTDVEHVPVGWRCPVCGRVWAPLVLCCWVCGPKSEPQPEDTQPDDGGRTVARVTSAWRYETTAMAQMEVRDGG